MKPYVITIGRQLGSGGRRIGRLLAEQLDIKYFDREILTIAAHESGYDQAIFERKDEKKGFISHAWHSLSPIIGAGDYYVNQLSDEKLFKLQSDAIRKAAAKESCLFIGRAADYVLRDHAQLVSVFISADLEERVRCICQRRNMTEKQARRLLESVDNKRADFYNFYSPKTWGEAASYDLCLNSGVLGYEGTAEVIRHFVEQRLALSDTPKTAADE
ncbi:AAA family ATPase [Alloprevotella tannerae]|uniref:cytidylate kinase-like family protein n=1 Tax=Alloprevotella tannerae TaxID=76122 RepID=UPI001EDBEC9F|nr:cytidylate kinase-like family protein [Alloprevotella tannerae]MCG2651326.1 cytidylate kinase-like family protein [Alloprevotella tannerae]